MYLKAKIKFDEYLVNENRTCQGTHMIGSPMRNITIKQCLKRCAKKKKCMFFFFTELCMEKQGQCSIPVKTGDYSSKVCKRAQGLGSVESYEYDHKTSYEDDEDYKGKPKGCCAFFTKCKTLGVINNSGHTCIKGNITFMYMVVGTFGRLMLLYIFVFSNYHN